MYRDKRLGVSGKTRRKMKKKEEREEGKEKLSQSRKSLCFTPSFLDKAGSEDSKEAISPER